MIIPDDNLISPFLTLIGELTVLFILIILIIGFILLCMTIYVIKTGNFIFPAFMKGGLLFLEGLMKGLLRLFGIDDQELTRLIVTLQNSLNKKSFTAVPVNERAIFIPQCLRAGACPAHLHEEGLKCRSCGLCPIGEAKKICEGLGYKFFIVPGSSFIKRMVRRYHPKALIGVGCLIEVKEGIEMGSQIGLIAMGVVTQKDGCVETSMNWDDLYSVALLGADRTVLPLDMQKRLPKM